MKNTMIFGGTGPIGQALAIQLSNTENVYIISRSKPKLESVNWLKCDLLDSIPFEKFPKSIDKIIYLSQYENYTDFPENALNLFQVNVSKFLEVLVYAASNKVKKIIYASSGGIYGNDPKPFSENDFLTENPTGWLSNKSHLNFYFKTKMISEIISKSFTHLMDITLLRFFFVYGGNQKSTMLFPRLINSVYNGQEVYIDDNGGLSLNPIYVDDASDAIVHCLQNDVTGSYNIAGSEVTNIFNIVESVGKILARKPVYKYIEKESSNNLIANIDSIVQTGWKPKINVAEGLQRVASQLIPEVQNQTPGFFPND